MLEAYLVSVIILLVAPLLICILTFPRKRRCSAGEYTIRLRQSIVTLVLILISTVLNIIRSQTSIKLFSYIAVAVGLAAMIYLSSSCRRSGKK